MSKKEQNNFESLQTEQLDLKSSQLFRQQSSIFLENNQQKDLSYIEHRHYRCRCCYIKLETDIEKISLSDWHVEIFRSMINVELNTDSGLSQFICSSCDRRLNMLAEFVQVFRNVQKLFNESLDNNNVEDMESSMIKDQTDENSAFQMTESLQITHDDDAYDHGDLIGVIKIEKQQITTQQFDSTPTTNLNLRSCYVRLERLNDMKATRQITSKLENTSRKVTRRSNRSNNIPSLVKKRLAVTYVVIAPLEKLLL